MHVTRDELHFHGPNHLWLVSLSWGDLSKNIRPLFCTCRQLKHSSTFRKCMIVSSRQLGVQFKLSCEKGLELFLIYFFCNQQNLIYPRHNFTRICLSPGLTSKLLQEAIEHKLQLIQRKEMNQMALQKSLAANAPTSKNLPGVKSRTQLLFLDDLNSADVDEFGIQPPLELLRQILSQGNNIPVTL